MPDYEILPVTLVTGFLGSGKSTLLADTLQGEAARDTAVLVNEFGAVGLDHLLVGAVDAQTLLLDNGCVCCSIRGELKDALASLFSRRARGEIPPFRRVVLETTGLATPAPIIATLLADPVIRRHYALHATVTVVDVLHAAQQEARHPEWRAQVTAADRLLISKADLAAPGAVDALRARLAILNPAADIVVRETAPARLLDLRDLLDPSGSSESSDRSGLSDLLFAPASSPDLLQRIGAAARLAPPHAAERDDITATCLQIDEPLDWQVFTLWFTMLLNRHGDRILRVKGLLAIAGADRLAVLHAVQHLVHPIRHLEADRKSTAGTAGVDDAHDMTAPATTSRLVFITEGMDGSQIDASYRRFRAALEDSTH
ncbi:MAG: CobW family GTP-binding protein [Janthinobacterium lividum]